MSTTKIEWTDVVWNPTRGCSRVSEGCRNCYAERIAARFGARFGDMGIPEEKRGIFKDFAVTTPGGPRWTGKVELIESKLHEPLHWRKPRRVFVNSMSDLFHENLPDEAIDRIFAVMALCPQHTFQVLTKRPERMRKWAADVSRERFGKDTPSRIHHAMMFNTLGETVLAPLRYPLPNVWLGVSVENQQTADERIPELLRTLASIRFVSYEPALGPVDFKAFLPGRINQHWSGHADECPYSDWGLDWIIAGGESGPGARPASKYWFYWVRDQCQAAGVPFFFKQWGGVHKKDTGAVLDGREWREFPVHK